MNKTQQGDVGVYAAQLHYAIEGKTTSKPSTEQSKYDLIVDTGVGLKRVQVKTSDYRPHGNYEVQLRTNGANYTTKNKHTKISTEFVDILFVMTMDGTCYEIPVEVVSGMSTVTMGKKYEKYIVRHIGGLVIMKVPGTITEFNADMV